MILCKARLPIKLPVYIVKVNSRIQGPRICGEYVNQTTLRKSVEEMLRSAPDLVCGVGRRSLRKHRHSIVKSERPRVRESKKRAGMDP